VSGTGNKLPWGVKFVDDGIVGAITAAAVTDPASDATIVAALKGILTLLGALAAAAVVDPASPASLIAVIKGVLTDLGPVTATAVIDPALSASQNALLKGMLKQLQGTGAVGTYMPVSLATPLTSVLDGIDVGKMSKGGIVVAHNAIAASVAEASCVEIDCRGFNSISVKMLAASITGGATWTGALYGTSASGETTGPCNSPKDDGTFAVQATPAIAANGTYNYVFRGVPNYVKIVPTLAVSTGTLTVVVTPMNL